MSLLTHKTTILFSPEEHQFLVQKARKSGITLGELVRQAIRKLYISPPRNKNKKNWEKMFKMKAPVGDWSDMEAEILKGRVE